LPELPDPDPESPPSSPLSPPSLPSSPPSPLESEPEPEFELPDPEFDPPEPPFCAQAEAAGGKIASQDKSSKRSARLVKPVVRSLVAGSTYPKSVLFKTVKLTGSFPPASAHQKAKPDQGRQFKVRAL
jgi:hypothetical protein